VVCRGQVYCSGADYFNTFFVPNTTKQQQKFTKAGFGLVTADNLEADLWAGLK